MQLTVTKQGCPIPSFLSAPLSSNLVTANIRFSPININQFILQIPHSQLVGIFDLTLSAYRVNL